MPLTDAGLAALITQVLWSSLAIAMVFGAIAQHTHFCTMGAVSDIVNMNDWGRMRMWLLAIGVAMIGFNVMVGVGWLDAKNSVYTAPKLLWLSSVVGGLLFGFGMVLASGCGSKTLVRAGGGSLKSLVVLVVMGVAAFATLRGITAVARVATLDAIAVTLPVGQDLPSLMAWVAGWNKQTAALVLGGGLGALLIIFSLAKPDGRSANNLLAGLGTGACVVALWWVSGQLGHIAEHPQTLEESFLATNSQRMESLSFVAPVAYTWDWLMFFSDKSKLLTVGIVSVMGVMFGSALVAYANKSFRWEGFAGTEDTANHLVGAVLMGVGGVTAMGCTVGQGLSGVSTLALGSFIALAGIMAGAVLALRYQMWRLDQLG